MGNPAWVLHGHFQALAAHGSESWPSAWQAVLGVPWLESVGALLALEEEIEQIVQSQPDIQTGPVIQHRAEWRRAILLNGIQLNPAMVDAWVLPDAAVNSLYTVGVIINGLPGRTREAPADAVNHLNIILSELREAIFNAEDLDNDLRAFLMENVYEMQSRIDLSRVTGSGPIEDLRADIVGSAATRPQMWDRIAASSVGEKVMAVLAALAVYNGGVATLDSAISNTEHLMRTISNVATHVVQQPRQIEPPSTGPKALSSRPADITVLRDGPPSA